MNELGRVATTKCNKTKNIVEIIKIEYKIEEGPIFRSKRSVSVKWGKNRGRWPVILDLPLRISGFRMCLLWVPSGLANTFTLMESRNECLSLLEVGFRRIDFSYLNFHFQTYLIVKI